MDFTKATYYQEKFSRHSIIKENIQSIFFEECEFINCNYIDCKFDNCRFLNCTFNECDLSNMTPMNCQFREIKFIKSKAIGIDWTKAEKIKELSFTECLINYSNFRLLKVPETKIIKCEAKEIDFIETDMNSGNFTDTDFENSVFFKTNLTKADFRGATNYSVDINTCNLKEAKFSLPEALSLLSNLDIIIE